MSKKNYHILAVFYYVIKTTQIFHKQPNSAFVQIWVSLGSLQIVLSGFLDALASLDSKL